MGRETDTRRVHFKSPPELLDRFDTVAELFEQDRTTLLVEAMQAYLDDRTDDAEFRRLVADRYFDGQLSPETVRELLGPETARRLRLLRADAHAEPVALPAPGDASVYDGDRRTVDPDADRRTSGPDASQ